MVDLTQHIRMPVFVTRKFLRLYPELTHHADDLCAEAALEMVECVSLYEKDDCGVTFATFASRRMRGKLYLYMLERVAPVRRHQHMNWSGISDVGSDVLDDVPEQLVDMAVMIDALTLKARIRDELLRRLQARPRTSGTVPQHERNVDAFLRILIGDRGGGPGGFSAAGDIAREWGVTLQSVRKAIQASQEVFAEWAAELRAEGDQPRS